MKQGPRIPRVRIVVYEKQTRWAALLRRESIIDIGEARSVNQTRTMLAQSPAGLLVVELQTSVIDEQLSLLLDLAGAERPITIVSVGDASLAALAAEAGAVAHVASPLDYEQLTSLARRYLQQSSEALANEPAENVRTAWRDRIPWPMANNLSEKETL